MRSPLVLTIALLAALLAGSIDVPDRRSAAAPAPAGTSLETGRPGRSAAPVALTEAWAIEVPRGRSGGSTSGRERRPLVLSAGSAAAVTDVARPEGDRSASAANNVVAQTVTQSLKFPTGNFLEDNLGDQAPNRRRLEHALLDGFGLVPQGGVPPSFHVTVNEYVWPTSRTITRTVNAQDYPARTFSRHVINVAPYVAINDVDATPAGEIGPALDSMRLINRNGTIIVNGGLRADSLAPITLTMRVSGGRLNGQDVALKGHLATFAVTDTTRVGQPGPAESPHCQAGDTCRFVQHGLLLMIDWGVGPAAAFEWLQLPTASRSRAMLTIAILSETIAATTDPTVIPLDAPELMSTLGVPGLHEHNRQVVLDAYRQQVASQQLVLTGRVPEWLYLYDFSGYQSDWSTGSRLVGLTPEQMPYFNQYDVGVQANLPIRDGDPGGNACGVMSIGMAMSSINQTPLITGTPGVGQVTMRDIFSNTMQIGLHHPDGQVVGAEQEQGFFPARAEAWLEGSPSYNGVTFTAGPNVTATVRINLNGITEADWQTIDAHLHANRPVMLRTTLSTGTQPGGGHYIVLLGTGKNDHVGEYYIVGDPAGHFYANPNQGGHNRGHYGSVAELAKLAIGLSHGGWFAIYPKALLCAPACPTCAR